MKYNWLRWFLTIPIAIIGSIVSSVILLLCFWAANFDQDHSQFYAKGTRFSIFLGCAFAFISFGVWMAPKHKKLVGLFLCLILFALIYNAYSGLDVYQLTGLVIGSAISLLVTMVDLKP